MSLNQSSELIFKLSNLQTRIFKRVEYQLNVHGISFTEFMVLYHLNNSSTDNMRRIELAEKVGLSASGITRLLAPMEKIGLIEKEINPRDARVSLVKLTKSGKQIFKDAEKSFNFSAESFTEPFNDKQRLKYIELTEALL